MIYSYAGGKLVPMDLSSDRSRAAILGEKSANIDNIPMRIVEFHFPSIGRKTSGRQVIFFKADIHIAPGAYDPRKPPDQPPPNWPEDKPWPPNQGIVETEDEVYLIMPLSESSLMFLLQPNHEFLLAYQNLTDDDASIETDFGLQTLTTHPAFSDPGGAMLTRSLNICYAEFDLDAIPPGKERHLPSKEIP